MSIASTVDTRTASTLLSLEERRRQAMLQSDVDALNRMFDDDLVYLHSTGLRDNKASYLEKLSSGRLRYEAISLTEQTVVRVNNCCLVGGRMVAAVHRAIGSVTVSASYSAVWFHAGDEWKLLAVHAEPLPH